MTKFSTFVNCLGRKTPHFIFLFFSISLFSQDKTSSYDLGYKKKYISSISSVELESLLGIKILQNTKFRGFYSIKNNQKQGPYKFIHKSTYKESNKKYRYKVNYEGSFVEDSLNGLQTVKLFLKNDSDFIQNFMIQIYFNGSIHKCKYAKFTGVLGFEKPVKHYKFKKLKYCDFEYVLSLAEDKMKQEHSKINNSSLE
jgi:hypothetical protein